VLHVEARDMEQTALVVRARVVAAAWPRETTPSARERADC